MKLFGVEKIVLTNAAGGLNPEVSQVLDRPLWGPFIIKIVHF